MDCSPRGFPVRHHLWEFSLVHIRCIGDAIQPSHPLSPSSPSAFNISQHQGLFQWVSSSHQVAKVLDLQLQHQSFQREQFLNATLPLRKKYDIVEQSSQTWLNAGVIWRTVTNTVAWVSWQVILISLVWGSSRTWGFFLKISSRWFLYAVQIENMGLQNVLKLKSSALDPDFSSTNDKQSSTPLRHSYPMCEMKTKISALKKIDPKDLTGFCVN